MKIMLFVMLMALGATANSADKVWVAITVSDPGGLYDFYGQMDQDRYNSLRAGNYKGAFLVLEKPFVYGHGNSMMFLEELEENGRLYGFQGDLHVRLEKVARFGQLDADLVQARIEEKRIGAQSRLSECPGNEAQVAYSSPMPAEQGSGLMAQLCGMLCQ